MKYALLVFVATWLSVFTLGLQSLNVNQGHYLAATLTSLGIGTGHIFLYKFMPSAGLLEFAAYYAGGVTGITSSMWFHRRAKAWIKATFGGRWEPGDGPRGQRPPKPPPPRDEHEDVGRCGAHGDTH